MGEKTAWIPDSGQLSCGYKEHLGTDPTVGKSSSVSTCLYKSAFQPKIHLKAKATSALTIEAACARVYAIILRSRLTIILSEPIRAAPPCSAMSQGSAFTMPCLKISMYLKARVTERKRESNLLAAGPFPKSHNSRGWARPKLEPSNSIWSLTGVTGTQALEA